MKFYRVVAAASLGAVLWAACSSPESRVTRTPATSTVAPAEFPGKDLEKTPEPRLGRTEEVNNDVITRVLHMQRASAQRAQSQIEQPSPVKFDLGSYRNDLAEKTCQRLDPR